MKIHGLFFVDSRRLTLGKYSYALARIAITGSKRAAIAAGIIPAINPIVEDTPRPNTIFFAESITCRLPNGARG
jgi:hypothetical protein